MSSLLEIILNFFVGMFIPHSSKRDKDFEKKQKERVQQNISLLSNLDWFSILINKPTNKKIIFNNSRMHSLLKNQPFVNSLLEDDPDCKKLFLKKLDEESKSIFNRLRN